MTMANKRKRYDISLTKAQADLILWALAAGREQNSKFLFHDDWDAGLTKRERTRRLVLDRQLLKALKTMQSKLIKPQEA
jgi:hypothetical protein